MSNNRNLPDGGKYTRPRRGFRAPSHYRDRLRRRGQTPATVHMETLKILRERAARREVGKNGHADEA